MGEFMGSDTSVALQRSLQQRMAEISQNPLLSNGGRIMNILDPAGYGWDNVRRIAHSDGMVGLTMVDRDSTLTHLATLFDAGTDLPYWLALTGSAQNVLPPCRDILANTPLPDGWTRRSTTAPDDETVEAAQRLNLDTGVAPTPAYYLRGEAVPSLLTCLYDDKGALAACASATMRYHPDGPMAGWLFAGSVSVAPHHRRRGLGCYVNAATLVDSHTAFGWDHALEQAKADNAASVGMIRRCGLSHDGNTVTVIINTAGGYVTR